MDKSVCPHWFLKAQEGRASLRRVNRDFAMVAIVEDTTSSLLGSEQILEIKKALRAQTIKTLSAEYRMKEVYDAIGELTQKIADENKDRSIPENIESNFRHGSHIIGKLISVCIYLLRCDSSKAFARDELIVLVEKMRVFAKKIAVHADADVGGATSLEEALHLTHDFPLPLFDAFVIDEPSGQILVKEGYLKDIPEIYTSNTTFSVCPALTKVIDQMFDLVQNFAISVLWG